MLIFVYGDDGFRVAQKVTQMKTAFQEKFDPSGMNLAEFPGKKRASEVGEVLNAVHALPFLGEKRMVIIKDLVSTTKKADMKTWVQGLENTPDSTIVIFWETVEPKKLQKQPLYKALKDASDVHQYPFPQLKGSELNRWVQTRISERGGIIEPPALRALVERVSADLWQMDNEIGKLIAFADNEKISVSMVDDLVHASFEGKIFQLIDAVSKKRPSEAVRLLQEERWSGANDHYLLTMLGRQVRILLGARALLDEHPRAGKQELAESLGIHPFVAQKALTQAKGFSMAQLKSVHDTLFKYDLALKTGKMDATMAVDLTTIQLAQ